MGNVLITGVSAGLGQALAHQYSMVGHTVYGLSRDERKVDGFIKHIECDITKKHQIPEKLQKLLKDVSEIDVVILQDSAPHQEVDVVILQNSGPHQEYDVVQEPTE